MNIREKTSHFAQELKKQTTTLLLSAFGLVGALAWNDAIKALIEQMVPLGTSALWAKFIYAVVVTLVLVLVTVIVLHPPKEEEKK